MAASHTGKKSNKLNDFNKNQVDQLIQAAAQYIASWTQREFKSLAQNKKIPLIWPLPKGGYVIGSRRIILNKGYWELIHNDKIEHRFENKQSAIFYCLAESVGRTYLASDIKSNDSVIFKHKNNLVYYESSLERAITRKDSVGISIWEARATDSRLRLELAQQDLEKTIKSTKYLKVWSE